MEIRTETYLLEKGYGSIDVKGDGFDCAIYFSGKPYAINWCDCAGSIGQYLVRTGIAGYKADLRQIRHVIESGLEEDQLISTQIYPLLQLFSSGEFDLNYYVSDSWDTTDEALDKGLAYYPYNDIYVLTRSLKILNADTVKQYEDKIRNGRRPFVITASVKEGWCEFVIDGHHKLEAYRKTETMPHIMNVEKNNSRLTLDEGVKVFNDAEDKSELQTYKMIKTKYGKV